MIVLGLCGYPQVGKDSLAALFVERHNFRQIAFADPLREAILALNPVVALDRSEVGIPGFFCRLRDLVDSIGWEGAKKHRDVRELLQRMGTEAGRDIHGGNCWVDLAKGRVCDAILDDLDGVIFTDTRFDNEVEMIRRLSDTRLIHIHRPNHGPVNGHSSEKMNYWDVSDVTIENDMDIETLYDRVITYLKIEGFDWL